MRARYERFVFMIHAAFGGILLAMEGMREMDRASDQQVAEELAGTLHA